jgi:hypothetical protein
MAPRAAVSAVQTRVGADPYRGVQTGGRRAYGDLSAVHGHMDKPDIPMSAAQLAPGMSVFVVTLDNGSITEWSRVVHLECSP